MEMHRPVSGTNGINERELSKLRIAAEASIELAPAAALTFCATHGVAVPHWLAKLAARDICNQLNPNRSKKRGRSSGALERCRQGMVDLMRWDAVLTARRWQKEFKETVKNHEDDRDISPQLKEHPRKMLAWVGHDWLRAYECASMLLKGTPAFGGADAMKASYCRVERNNKDARESWRYFLFEPEFLTSIGLEHPSRWGQSSKFVPLYNLTL